MRRTGGFAGLAREGELDLAEAPELAALVDRIDVGALRGLTTTHADRYTYVFDLDGTRASVPEQHLTDDLRVLAERVLAEGAVEGGGHVQ